MKAIRAVQVLLLISKNRAFRLVRLATVTNNRCRTSAALAAALALASSSTHSVTFVVTTTDDSGPGSLRQAILDSNAGPGPNEIDFSIGVGPSVIFPRSPLPTI